MPASFTVEGGRSGSDLDSFSNAIYNLYFLLPYQTQIEQNTRIGKRYEFKKFFFLTSSCFLVDVNECLENSTCLQVCDNTEGSYNCSCWTGYQLSGDLSTCEGGSSIY